ncbi:hypothetical protein AYI70_g8510 [Smittium culicis]|uniref:Secreted protein n=1 Tax=Smittium culicis TaxID=133412 RepID=A0A1R1XFL0_9FUNG|nr:hypothetical protein AYI70_g8510 [Smittium culicis]
MSRGFSTAWLPLFSLGATITKCRSHFSVRFQASSILFMSLALRKPVTANNQHKLAVSCLKLRSIVGPQSLKSSNTGCSHDIDENWVLFNLCLIFS